MIEVLKSISAESIVGAGLVIALFYSIYVGMNELSMSIASGLVGYIGHDKIQQHSQMKG